MRAYQWIQRAAFSPVESGQRIRANSSTPGNGCPSADAAGPSREDSSAWTWRWRQEGALPAGAVLEHEAADVEARDRADGEQRGGQVQHTGRPRAEQRSAGARPFVHEGRERLARGSGQAPATAPRVAHHGATQTRDSGRAAAEPEHSARGQHAIGREVPEHDRQQRKGEDVDVLPVADLLEEGAERQGGQRKQHADPGTPRERAHGLGEPTFAFDELAQQQFRPLLHVALGRSRYAALAGAPARQFRGGARRVLAIRFRDQGAVAVRAFHGADQQDFPGSVLVHGCIIAVALGDMVVPRAVRDFSHSRNGATSAFARPLTLDDAGRVAPLVRLIDIKRANTGAALTCDARERAVESGCTI